MALTINEDDLNRRGGTNNFSVTGTLAFDSAYPTGGYTLSATDLALSQFESVWVNNAGGLIVSVVLSADKSSAQIIVYDAVATEESNGTNLSGQTNIQFQAEGK